MHFTIEGGHKLKGSIAVDTSKNGAMGLMTAALLNRAPTTLRRVPRIEEVYRIIEVLESIGVPTRVQSAISMDAICEPYIRRRAQRHMEKGRVVIFAAGIGNPFFTTDTGAALRAIEMGCDALLKGTQVDGVYTADPKLDATATRYTQVAYQELLSKNLRVMDPSAVSLMRDNNIPIVVFSLKEEGALLNVLYGRGTSTTITNEGG